jgi:hypothetical protein
MGRSRDELYEIYMGCDTEGACGVSWRDCFHFLYLFRGGGSFVSSTIKIPEHLAPI